MLPLLLACSDPAPDSTPSDGPRALAVTVDNPALAYPFPASGSVPWMDRGAHASDRVPSPVGHALTGYVGWSGLVVRFDVPLFEERDRVDGVGVVSYWDVVDGELVEIDFDDDPNVLDVTMESQLLTVIPNDAIDGGAWFVHHGEPELTGWSELAAGDPEPLRAEVSSGTGLTAVFGPGVVVVHSPDEEPFFTLGQPDRGVGLESLAEDGNPLPLGNALVDSYPFVTVYGPGDATQGYSPIEPGGTTEFSVELVDDQVVSVAFMFSQSNDVFVHGTFGQAGDVTSAFELLDAGTEANQEPGFGSDQGPRQVDVNTGEADPNRAVRVVDDGFTYPAIDAFLKVTATAE